MVKIEGADIAIALEIACYAAAVDLLSGSLDPACPHMDAFTAIAAGLRRLASSIDGADRAMPALSAV